MNEENIKIAKIKKSCHAGKIVSRILFVVVVIFTVLGIVGGLQPAQRAHAAGWAEDVVLLAPGVVRHARVIEDQQ